MAQPPYQQPFLGNYCPPFLTFALGLLSLRVSDQIDMVKRISCNRICQLRKVEVAENRDWFVLNLDRPLDLGSKFQRGFLLNLAFIRERASGPAL